MSATIPRGPSASQPQKATANDPRLHNRPQRPNAVTSQPSVASQTPTSDRTPNSALPAVQSLIPSAMTPARNVPPTDSNDFALDLSNFIESHITFTMKRQEKENLERQASHRHKYFKYLDANPSAASPTVQQMLHAYKDIDELEIRRLNDVMTEHAAKSLQFTQALQQHRLPTSLEGGSGTAPQSELRSVSSGLTKPARSQSPAALDERLSKLSASVTNQSQHNRKMEGSISDMAQWKDDIERGNAKLPLSALPDDILSMQHGLKKNVDELHVSRIQLQSTMVRLSNIEKDICNIKKLEDELQAGAKRLENHLRQQDEVFNHLKAELARFEHRLNGPPRSNTPLGSHNTAHSTGNTPVASNFGVNSLPPRPPAPNNLTAASSAIVRPTSDKPATASSTLGSSEETSPIDQRMAALEQAMTELRVKKEKLEESYRYLNAGVNPIIQKGPEWVGTVDQWIQRTQNILETTQTLSQTTKALVAGNRSLETRYNNINTEPMVQKMAHAIREMYPTVPTMVEQINTIREAERIRAAEIASMKREIGQLNTNANRDQLVELEHKIGVQLLSLKETLNEQYEKYDTRSSERVQSLQDALNQQAQTQSSPDSQDNPSSRQISDQIKSLEAGQQAQALRFHRELSERLSATQDALKSSSQQQISDQIKSLEETYGAQREEFETKISERVNALQEVQKADSSTTAGNLEHINFLKGRFEILQNAVENLGELGDKYAEDIATLSERLQPVEALQPQVTEFSSQLRDQDHRIQVVESPIQALKTQLEDLQAFGTAEEIQGYCEQLRGLKREDIVSKLAKLNDLLSERIVSYHAEVESSQAPTPSNPEAHANLARSTADEDKVASGESDNNTQVTAPSKTDPGVPPTTSAQPPPIHNIQPPPPNTSEGPAWTAVNTSSPQASPAQKAKSGAKRKRSPVAPSQSDRPDKSVSTPTQTNSPVVPGPSQPSKKKNKKAEALKKKERRRQSPLHQ
ncbi:hypothetical protein N7492_001990 [Penicillium capsulatum]|uniref:Uncharacterized protein n=1 Tax=Penicillium capsulatum TaxID=69766 RepID=A0A9W9LV96_9EURO|nr:hypothetical protein N7492_001990 [Penicillium capsulatum]KAJ6123390.1 hypothetical protein N7512_005855 [Penicillium capsulatum]